MKANKIDITQDELKELFWYEDGNLIWKNARGCVKKGTVAGTLHAKGYTQIKVMGKIYRAHRLIWIYHKGAIAVTLQIDHINRNRSDNHINNLRLVSQNENQWNRNGKGFAWHKASNKYQAQIQCNGKLRYLGLYETVESAREAYLKAKEKYHTIQVMA
jgi:hypothetical protein